MDATSYRILLVANDPDETVVFQDRVAELANGVSFEVAHTQRLDEALTKTRSETFHLIVLDLTLPDCEGLNTFIRMSDSAAAVPVVVMVDSQHKSLALEAARNGAQDYLVKGEWNREMLERTIKHSRERHRLLTELREARDAARECEQKFRTFFETTHDAVYMKDKNLLLTDVNPAMAALFNVDRGDLVGTKAERSFGRRVAKQIEGWDRRVLEGESIEQEHTRMVNGTPMTFLDLRVPLRNAGNEIIGVCCMSRNITERSRVGSNRVADDMDYPSETMAALMDQAVRIAATDGTVLLLGDSGTGKDYLARWIHDHSDRSNSPYFALNCAALSPELAESELFGHESGAFTGARGRKRGLLELAEGGTLLLNEVGELPLSLQSKLLTFLDTRSFLRVGGEQSITVDARLMAATHRDLAEEVANRRFLAPLYHRLNVFTLRLPPLRERIEDLPLLVDSLIRQLGSQMQLTKIPALDSRLLDGLAAHNWPGNIRELKNVLERALMLWNGGRLDLKLASESTASPQWTRDLPFPSAWTLKEVTNEVTKQMCMQALRRTKGNKKEAAELLGTSRDALYRYIRRFGIDADLLA